MYVKIKYIKHKIVLFLVLMIILDNDFNHIPIFNTLYNCIYIIILVHFDFFYLNTCYKSFFSELANSWNKKQNHHLYFYISYVVK
jgi:hypothetical protein